MDCGPPGSSIHRILQEYCSGLPFPFPADLPDPGIELMSAALQADSLPSEPPGKPPKSTRTKAVTRWACTFEIASRKPHVGEIRTSGQYPAPWGGVTWKETASLLFQDSSTWNIFLNFKEKKWRSNNLPGQKEEGLRFLPGDFEEGDVMSIARRKGGPPAWCWLLLWRQKKNVSVARGHEKNL